jgi:ParB/RepB/Spo0J family partition protein
MEQFSYVYSDQIEVIENFNPRKEENYDVDNLYQSIKEENILTPILVMQTSKKLSDNRPVYKLFEGHRRYKTLCIIEAEEDTKRDIPVRIFEVMTEDELLMKALILGITGKQLKTSEKAKAISKLYNFGYNTIKIANMMQITQANVSTLKKFDKLPISLQTKIDNELISFSETLKLMEQVGSAKTLEKIINQAIENKGGNKVYSKDIINLVVNSDDDEIKNVQTNITNNIKAKNVVDEDISTMVAPDTTLPQTEDSNLSLDEVKAFMGIKTPKGEPKTKVSSLMKIYDYLTDEKLKNVLNPNSEKIEILKAIMDYQDGLMSMDNLCDYFLDEK